MSSAKNQIWLCWLAAGGLALAAGQAFHAQSIAPLREQEMIARRGSDSLNGRIADAREVIREVREMEAQAVRERSETQALQRDFPAGPALVWFPDRMKKHFDRSGTIEVVSRLNTTRDEPELPGFERSYWAVELPIGKEPGDVREACLTIAELEPLDPSVRVLDVSIRPDEDIPGRRVAVINVAVLSPKVDAFW